ncbi:MAG: outer membrane protein assembly factor BamD [Gammaproteobacteria bacterium]
MSQPKIRFTHPPLCLRTPKRLLGYVLLISLFSFSSGCANNDDANAKQLSEQQYYQSAQKAMDVHNYVMAVEQLEQLESRYPFGRYAIQTQLDLIYAYYRSLEYTAAALQAERFIRQHPNHKDVDYAYYMKGLSTFSVDRGFKARILPTSPAQRDIHPLHEAFSDFSLFLNKFPNSRYAADAQQRLVYLRNLLAEHELVAARYYLERRAFIAVLNRGKTVMENYPETPAVPEAMALVVKAYRELGLNDLAQQTESVLSKNFPHYPELNETGQLKYTPSTRSAKPWYHWLTFGLIG